MKVSLLSVARNGRRRGEKNAGAGKSFPKTRPERREDLFFLLTVHSLLMISGIGVADLHDDVRDFVVREAGIEVKTHENMGTGEEKMP